MQSAALKQGVTVDEYLAFEREATEKHFLWDGEVFEMWGREGARPSHNTLATNALCGVANALRGGPCRVFNSQQRLWVPRKSGIVYADVIVICGRFALHEGTRDVIDNPVVVVEVLSPGTESFDRGDDDRT